MKLLTFVMIRPNLTEITSKVNSEVRKELEKIQAENAEYTSINSIRKKKRTNTYICAGARHYVLHVKKPRLFYWGWRN